MEPTLRALRRLVDGRDDVGVVGPYTPLLSLSSALLGVEVATASASRQATLHARGTCWQLGEGTISPEQRFRKEPPQPLTSMGRRTGGLEKSVLRMAHYSQYQKPRHGSCANQKVTPTVTTQHCASKFCEKQRRRAVLSATCTGSMQGLLASVLPCAISGDVEICDQGSPRQAAGPCGDASLELLPGAFH